MARLNEPPQVVGESVDALKRRFIRQNREIARANSTQSLRIRNLEAETSRLLSENITLREENLNLKHELEKSSNKVALQNVAEVRDKLESKVDELNVLLADLGMAQHAKLEKKVVEQRSKRRSSLRKSPSARNWRSATDFSDAANLEGRLPPIHEDKYFPRKTLDLDEIRATLPEIANVTDSPELGPPPIAFFDDSDPVKRDIEETNGVKRNTSIETKQSDEKKNVPQSIFFSHLETRRRRKDGATGSESSERSVEERTVSETAPKATDRMLGQSLKVGAKRKLSVREDDEKSTVTKNVDKDTFAYSRGNKERGSAVKDTSTRKQSQELSAAQKLPTDRPRVKNHLTSSRRALGEKSVNTDPVTSPKKEKPINDEKFAEAKKSPSRKSRERDPQKERPLASRAVKPLDFASALKASTVEQSEIVPITPAPPDMDLFSPASSNPSIARAESRDTPPPSELATDGSSNAARPSRRQRGAVSYAEPNLRDKMRRPTKELVDAVTDIKLIRSTSTKTDGSRSEDEATNKDKPNLISIKKEADPADSTLWKTEGVSAATEPTSPLHNKSSTSLPSSIVVADRRRRSSALRPGSAVDDEPFGPRFSTTSSSNDTIAALLARSQKRVPRTRDSENPTLASTATTMQQPALKESASVFDFHDSSPAAALADEASADKPQRTSRRYSSVPENLARIGSSSRGIVQPAKSRGASASATAESEEEVKHAMMKETLVESVTASMNARASRRRETVANGATSASGDGAIEAATSDAEMMGAAGSGKGAEGEVDGLGSLASSQVSLRRAQRAERRRSMMV